ncbi:macrolide family glycosyltransferase [Nonomuraea sp. NPDC059007]|uniref:macrolide family glycosyltransferase n=1 Tax=Nonomuraea sp. NPDC059007 TaxID=3346692 RepID=UPI00368EF499
MERSTADGSDRHRQNRSALNPRGNTTLPHIAMVSIPAPGHVNPSLEVIRELAARGHHVTYANAPSYRDIVQAAGATHVPYTSLLPQGTAWPDDTIAQLDLFLRDNISMTSQLRAAYTGRRPDLFLYDIGAAPARVLAEQWNIPAIQLSPTYVAWDGYETDMAPMIEQLYATPEGADYHRRAEQWLREEGITTPHADFVGRPPRCLVLIPRALQPHAERVDPGVYTFIGPCLGERGTWNPPPGAGKILLISLGSAFTDQPAFYRTCLRAFGDLPGWHVIMQIGRRLQAADLGPVPANVEIHPWVEQLAILRHAAAFLTHAGMGGAAEGLACGVPMIAVPQGVDQFANADHLVALGVARRIDTGAATPDLLRGALHELTTDPQVAARLTAVRHELTVEGGARHAADLIEAAL